MTILFTGHKGFLGRELIPYLREDSNVVKFEGDLTDFKALSSFVREKRVQRVIHAAVRGGRRTKVDTPSTLINNLKMTSNVIRLGIPFITFCSGAIYNRTTSIREAKENESLNSYPPDFYGQSKYVARSLLDEKVDGLILRFFNVFGQTEGNDRFITANVLRYISRNPMQVFSDFRMDFFYVQDVLPVINSWIQLNILPKEINLVYPTKYLLSEVCGKINTLSKYRVPVRIEESANSHDYTGSGDLLQSLGMPLLGLEYGLTRMYKALK